jgi:hypothetical protein
MIRGRLSRWEEDKERGKRKAERRNVSMSSHASRHIDVCEEEVSGLTPHVSDHITSGL